MNWAEYSGDRVEAWPGGRARCPQCSAEVLAKCGEIVAWHWAHEASDCDPWFEPESEWHLWWKRLFPSEWQEVPLGAHRADIATPRYVIELQASHISSDEIRERERFYRRMIWLVRGHDFAGAFDLRPRGEYVSFRWKWPRKSWFAARCPIYIDFGTDEGLFAVRRLHANVPCGGWGEWVTYKEWMHACGVANEEMAVLA